MKRYVVTERPSGVNKGLYETLAEALSASMQVIEAGKGVSVMDSQGSGVIMVGHFDLLEAEGLVGHSLGSEKIQHPTPICEILELMKLMRPKKTIFHWDVGG